jgi:hypothetical protein
MPSESLEERDFHVTRFCLEGMHMSYAETNEQEHGAGCPALLESAHPEVYRRNAFRVAGLTVEATPRDISRHTEKLRMMQKYSANGAGKTPLALSPPPDEHGVRDALHKLHDPEKRLIDEFFWFWPHQLGQSKADEALTLLARDDIDHATKHWFQMEQSSESHVSMHNLAVLFHCLALDWEQVALTRELAEEEAGTVRDYWDHAFRRWKVVLEHEPFWSRLSARIRALEDPRLTTGLARRMRNTLPIALLSINAALAVRYAEAGNMEAAKRQIEIMKMWEASGDGQKAPEVKRKAKSKTGPPPLPVMGALVEQTLRDAFEPIRQRIKSICKNAEGQADKEPQHGDKATREVIAHTKPLLAILDALLPAGNATRDAAHDEVAVCALHCQIPYGNKTENWKVSLELLQLALPIAVGQAIRDRIQENINTVKTNQEYGMCWYCKTNPKDDKATLEVKMFGDVNRTPTWQGTQITWRHGTFKVPRCAACKSAHNRSDACTAAGGVLGAILGLGGCVAIVSDDEDMWFGGLFFLAVLAAIGAGIGAAIGGALRPKTVKPESAKGEFPSVKELLKQGWQYGEKPNTDS